MSSVNLSIVLVIKDRIEYSYRFLKCLNEQKCPFTILVADGGSTEQVYRHIKFGNFPNLNIMYKKYPYDATLDMYHEKVADIVSYIETPLSIMMDDDDFIFINGIKRSIDFLRNNKHFSSCRGLVKNVYVHGGAFGQLQIVNDLYYKEDVIGNTALERIRQQNKLFHGQWHNVEWSINQKLTWIFAGICKPTNMRFTEQLISYLNMVFGSNKRDKYLYLLHQSGTPRVPGSENHFPEQMKWINSEHWIKNFSRMADTVSTAIHLMDNTGIDENRKEFIESYYDKLPDLKERLEERFSELNKKDENLVNKLLKKAERIFYTESKVEIQESFDYEYDELEEIQIMKNIALGE